jgi:hypothetical protein
VRIFPAIIFGLIFFGLAIAAPANAGEANSPAPAGNDAKNAPDSREAMLASVKSALDWLKRHQDKNGGFDSDNYMALCKDNSCDGEAKAAYFDVGVTALAVLAFLNYPDLENKGEYKACIENGVKYLISQQDNTGRIGTGEGDSHFYNHAIALYAICEYYGRTKDKSVKKNLETALKYGLDAQNPGYGWKYEPREGRNDTSITCWMITALNSARNAGYTVPEQSFKDALNWVNRVTDTEGYTGYSKPGERQGHV